jgi:hypothetical protein
MIYSDALPDMKLANEQYEHFSEASARHLPLFGLL